MDAVVTTNDGQAHILHNDTSTANHWLTLQLVGHKSNRDAIGAEIELADRERQPIRHRDHREQLSFFQRQAGTFWAGSG